MRSLSRVAFLVILFSPLASAQLNKSEASNLPDHPFQVDYPSGRRLNLHLRSGDIRVVGRNDNKIAVRVEAENLDRAREVKVRFERLESSAELTISGGPRNNIQRHHRRQGRAVALR